MEDKRDGGEKKRWGILSKWKKGSQVSPIRPSPQEPERVRDENKIEPGERMKIDEATHLTAPDNSLYIVPTTAVERDGRGYKFIPAVYIVTGRGDITRQVAVDMPESSDQNGPGFHIVPALDRQTTIINNTPIPFGMRNVEQVPTRKKIKKGGCEGFILPEEPVTLVLSPSTQVTFGEDNQGKYALFYGEQIVPLRPDEQEILRVKFGRQPEPNSLIIPSPEISRSHGEVMVMYGGGKRYVFITDSMSKNGIEVAYSKRYPLRKDQVTHDRDRLIQGAENNKWFVSDKADELKNETLEGERQGYFTFIFPTGTSPELRTQIFGISTSLNAQLRIPDTRETSTTLMIVPSKEYLTRSCASGSDILMNTAAPDVAAHELIHAKLYGQYGKSAADAVVEGMAVYITFEVVTEAPHNNVEKHYGYNDALALDDQNLLVGLSHTAFVENVGRELDTQGVYERSYRFGRYLVEYIDTTYGRDFLLEFYKNTCNRVIDKTGRVLANNGHLEEQVKQRDIIAAAMENTASLQGVPFDIAVFNTNWDTFYKAKTREIKNKGLLPPWVDGL